MYRDEDVYVVDDLFGDFSTEFAEKSEAQRGISCATPGNPYILHCFPAHKTDLTSEHREHLARIASKIVHSFRGSQPIKRVNIVGHSATWKGISKAEYGRRAIVRAKKAQVRLRERLANAGLGGKVDIKVDHRADNKPLVDNMVNSSSQTARKNRAINRRVEIILIRGRKQVPSFLPNTIVFSLDPNLNWNNPGGNELNDLLNQCSKNVQPILPGDDDRVPVGNTGRLPFRWICAIFSIFPVGPGNPKPRAARSSGFLLDNRHLVTSAHVLYKFAKHDPRLLQIPDSIVFIPGFDPGLSNPTPFGIFKVMRKSRTGTSNIFVPGEWILSIPSERRVGDPEFDYAVIDISRKKQLSPGKSLDSWTTVSPILASAAALKNSEPDELARLILSARGKGFRTAGYPADKPCVPMQTGDFEFVDLSLEIGSDHNVMVNRADTFFGTSGSPVWLERNVIGNRSGIRNTQKLLIGIVEGARLTRLGAGVVVTKSTLITPKVFERLKHPSLLSPV